jgi:methylglutaconyl-CoA hydratase
MNTELVLATITKNQIGILTLNRPDKHNAFNHKMIAEIIQKLNFFQQQAIRFLVINANGKHFSAGADLNWMAEMATKSIDANLEDATELAKMLYLIYHFDKPTIALVQGSALGGGAGIVAACDIVITTDQSQFGFTETKMGLIPATISPYVINSIGPKMANYYFLTAEIFDAAIAKKIGLCHEIVSLEQLLEIHDLTIIKQLNKNGPLAISHAKKLVRSIGEKNLNDTHLIPITANMIAQLRASKEGQEGISAFLEKRQPNWALNK